MSLLAFIAARAEASVCSVRGPRYAVALSLNAASDACMLASSGHGSPSDTVHAHRASQFDSARNHGLTRSAPIAFTTLDLGSVSDAALQLVIALSSAVRLVQITCGLK